MKDCDIYLDFGNNTRIIVTSKEDSAFKQEEDLDVYLVRVPESTKDNLSIDEIVYYIWNNSTITKLGDPTLLGPKVLGKVMADSIKSGESDLKSTYNKNRTKLTYGYSTFVTPEDTKVSLVPNTTIEELKLAYPEALKALPETDKHYNISWLKFVRNQGYPISGRVFTNGLEMFVLRTLSDLEQFALTERKRDLVLKYVNADSIKSEEDRGSALNDRYQQKILRVVEQIKNNPTIVKRIKDEYGLDVNMQTVLLDYLYNKSSYNKPFYYLEGDKLKMTYMNVPLRDCINELNHVKVLYQDEESELAAALRGISYNREKLGKKSLYELLEGMYGQVEFIGKVISRKEFSKLNKAEMQEFLQHYFKGDALLGYFEVESVNLSDGKEKIQLTSRDLQELYKSRKGADKTSYKKAIIEALGDDDVENINLLQSKLGTLFKDENGEVYDIVYNILKKDGKPIIVAEYTKFNLSDDDIITVKYKGLVLKNLYENVEIGWNTKDFIETVNELDAEDPVIDGKYHGYYIFKKSKEDLNYFISKSILFPDLYIRGKFKTLKAAKLAVISYNSVSKISKSTMLDLKTKMLEGTETTYSALIDFLAKPQQTIESLDVKFKSIKEVRSLLDISSKENLLFKGQIKDVIDYYSSLYSTIYDSKYRTPLRATLLNMLDTPEKAGIFILKMLDNRVMETNKELSDELKVDIILNTLLEINNAPIKQYLVKKVTPVDNRYRVYLSGWSDVQANVNAIGRVRYQDKDLSTKVCITKGLRNVMNYFNNVFFAGSNVKIQIVSTDTLTNGYYDKDIKWSEILGDSDKSLINGFVYNNTIYINQSNVKNVENAMYHEVFHIVLGAIRANNEKDYLNILSTFEGILYDTSKKELRKSLSYFYNRVKAIYPNLARLDKLEEMLVMYLALEMEQSLATYFGLDETKTFDNIKLQLFEIFKDINSKVKTALFSTLGSDSEFLKGFLKEGTTTSMLRNQQATALMEKSIGNGEIIENCGV